MALQSIGITHMPDYPLAVVGAPSFSTQTVDADDEAIGCVFEAPETGTITGFGFCTGTLTAGDAGTVFALRDVDSTATPAVPGTTTHASGTVNVAASNTWYEVSGLSYAATQGERLAITATRPTAGTLNTQFRTFLDDCSTTPAGMIFPYAVAFVAAAWTASIGAPVCGVNYGGTWYPIRGMWPISALNTTNVGTGSTPDVVGNIWIPRIKCRVRGCWAWFDMDGGTLIKVYDSDGVTVLATCTCSANVRVSTGANVGFYPFDDALGPTSWTPTVGTTYYLGIEPNSATTLAIYDFTIGTLNAMNMFTFGADMYFVSSKNPSGTASWTGTTTRRCFLGVQIDQFDDGVSSGGGGVLQNTLMGQG